VKFGKTFRQNFAKLLGEILLNTFWRNYPYKNATKFGKIHYEKEAKLNKV
jgi:hypothetical protein